MQTLVEPNGPAPWGVHDLRRGELEVSLGALWLRLRERAGEIWAAYGYEGDPPPSSPEPSWNRWATSDWEGRVRLSPGFPDRPMVVDPEHPFRIVREAEARIYVRVPLWLHLDALGRSQTSLLRIPTVKNSDTWWGTFEAGELCYWHSTTARRCYDDTLFSPHLAMCPVQLVNRSTDSLPVEKIAIRPSYLSLYALGEQIWADETRVRYQGDAEGSQLDIGGEPPREAEGARVLAPPRMRMARGFRAMTFGRLMSFT